MCAEDARSELPRILHDAGFVLFSLNALKIGRSEQVAYNWSVLTYTSCAGLAATVVRCRWSCEALLSEVRSSGSEITPA